MTLNCKKCHTILLQKKRQCVNSLKCSDTSPSSSNKNNNADYKFPNGINPDFSNEIPCPTDISKQTTYLDLSKQNITHLPSWLVNFKNISTLNLSENRLTLDSHDCNVLRMMFKNGSNLVELDLSQNEITDLSLDISQNCRDPKNVLFKNVLAPTLKKLDLSSNKIQDFEVVCHLKELTKLQISGNEIFFLPESLSNMLNLEYLYLGYNKLERLSCSIAKLSKLKVLALNNNKLSEVTPNLKKLANLQVFHLHNNSICSLPRILVDGLPSLKELSLRNNPLIDKFVRKRFNEGRKHTAPSLFELACRTIKMHDIPYSDKELSPRVQKYLQIAKKCPNPNCCGVYFDDKYLQVKFVDTCGAYRLPLLQYLCSPNCFEPSDPATSSSASEGTDEDSSSSSEELRIEPSSVRRDLPINYQQRIQVREVHELSRRVQLGGLGVTQEEALRMTTISGL